MVTSSSTRLFFRPSAVLFACNLNIIRSPMAEAILKRHLGNHIHVASCGIRNGAEVDGFMIAVMAEIGIDLTAHHPQTFDELNDAYYDLIISLSPEAQDHITAITRAMDCEIEYWPTRDATLVHGGRDERLAAYRQVRDHLAERIAARFGPWPSNIV